MKFRESHKLKKIGFNKYTYFKKLFKKKYEITPRILRQLKKSNKFGS